MSDSGDELWTFHTQLEELLDRRRLRPARELLGRALPRFPNDELLLYYAAWIDYVEDNNDAALERCQHLLTLNPKTENGRALMADIYEDQDNHPQAEQMLLSLLNDYPKSAHYIAGYALLMLQTVHTEKATALAAEAMRIDPENSRALRASLLCSLVNGDKSAVDASLSELLAREPESFGTAISLVQVLANEGRNKAALRVAEEMVRAQPDNESLVDMVIELRQQAHWSIKPLWPMQRFGWGASIGLWLIAVGMLQAAKGSPIAGVIAVFFLAYVVYSWVWPPLLKKWMSR